MKAIDFGKKPVNTKIRLTKSTNILTIYIPENVRKDINRVISIFAIFWNGIVLLCVNNTIQSPSHHRNITHILVLLILSIVGVCLDYAALFLLFGKTCLQIDRQEISLNFCQMLLGQKITPVYSFSQCEVTKIIFNRKYNSSELRLDVPATLSLEFDDVSLFEISSLSGGIKHESDIEWLAYEISEWLDKPLTVVEHPAR